MPSFVVLATLLNKVSVLPLTHTSYASVRALRLVLSISGQDGFKVRGEKGHGTHFYGALSVRRAALYG